jgi:hypothetical protein
MGLRSGWVTGLALLVLGSCQGSATEPQHTRLGVGRVYMGVACPQPSSIRCDRVGLAVWLTKRAARLEASIAGRPVGMRWRATVDAVDYGATKHRRLEYYEGYLSPAGLIDGPLRVRPDRGRYHWIGGHRPTGRVRLVARYRNGSSARARLHVGLAAGWG